MPRFLAAQPNTQLITLPWDTSLAEWPEESLVALPRGISRHVVRFVRVGNEVYAFKEVMEHLALHEYELLRDLTRLDTPSVEAVGVVTLGQYQADLEVGTNPEFVAAWHEAYGEDSTPDFMAASATAEATLTSTRGSKGLGMM